VAFRIPKFLGKLELKTENTDGLAALMQYLRLQYHYSRTIPKNLIPLSEFKLKLGLPM
jgi:hypothetical protein